MEWSYNLNYKGDFNSTIGIFEFNLGVTVIIYDIDCVYYKPSVYDTV